MSTTEERTGFSHLLQVLRQLGPCPQGWAKRRSAAARQDRIPREAPTSPTLQAVPAGGPGWDGPGGRSPPSVICPSTSPIRSCLWNRKTHSFKSNSFISCLRSFFSSKSKNISKSLMSQSFYHNILQFAVTCLISVVFFLNITEFIILVFKK